MCVAGWGRHSLGLTIGFVPTYCHSLSSWSSQSWVVRSNPLKFVIIHSCGRKKLECKKPWIERKNWESPERFKERTICDDAVPEVAPCIPVVGYQRYIPKEASAVQKPSKFKCLHFTVPNYGYVVYLFS